MRKIQNYSLLIIIKTLLNFIFLIIDNIENFFDDVNVKGASVSVDAQGQLFLLLTAGE